MNFDKFALSASVSLVVLRRRHVARVLHTLLVALLLVVLVLPASPVALAQAQAESVISTAQTGTAAEGLAGLTVQAEESGTRLLLDSPLGSSVAETIALAGEQARYQGYDLPLQTVALRVTGADAVTALQLLHVEAVDLPADAVQPGPPEEVPFLPLDAASAAAAGEEFVAGVDDVIKLALQPDPALPVAPVFVLRSGQMGDVWVVVLAVTPIYQEAGVTRFATRVEAYLPGAQPYGDGALEESAAEAAARTGEATVSAAASPDLVEACGDNILPLVDSGERILRVSSPGLQTVSRSALGPLAKVGASELSLTLDGVPVAIRVTKDSLIFYADSVGDRWNPTDAYVLRSQSSAYPAKVMAAAQTVTGLSGSGTTSVVVDRGVWRNNTLYSSSYRGFDGDHWSAGDLWIPHSDEKDAPTPLSVSLDNSEYLTPPNKLPLASGAANLTFNITPYQRASDSPRTYNLIAKVGGSNTTVHFPAFPAPVPPDNWPDGLSESATFASNPASLTLSLSQVSTYTAKSGLLVDSIAYLRPVKLELGGNGAVFEGNAGQNSYRWTGAASGFSLYDVTDPSAPIPLTGASDAGFTDGRGAARRYLVTGTGFSHTPAVEVKYVHEYSKISGVQAIYITANPEFASALKPLTDHRCKSYKVAVVDVQAIYNSYSNSQVSADGIRDFLRDAWFDGDEVDAPPFNLFTWKPISVVMVGDATYDPWNYMNKAKSFNLVPAYMHEEADPIIDEAACDNCYGQLNGDDPHTGDATTNEPGFFVMEIYVGRIPANTAGEVADVANKIVRYETQGRDLDMWRANTLFFADNYWVHDGNGGFFKDTAGNFAQTSDMLRSIVVEANGASVAQRVYYDPAPQLNTPSAVNDWWRSNTRAELKQNVLTALNSGPALILYNGHANHYHMGSTESPADDVTRQYVLMFQDVGLLGNTDKLFVLLSMTCQTSQFVLPTDGGRTIDEYYLLSPANGAVATWGSTGLSAVAGHEALQEGFLNQLLSKRNQQTLGVLLRAGYENVLLHGVAADDVLRTFMLMGDPLTKFRFISQPSPSYLPLVENN